MNKPGFIKRKVADFVARHPDDLEYVLARTVVIAIVGTTTLLWVIGGFWLILLAALGIVFTAACAFILWIVYSLVLRSAFDLSRSLRRWSKDR